MASIKIQCPSCGKKGDFEILEEKIKNVARGLLAVNIAENTICEHSFIAYVDRNFTIRDYFMADFQLEIPEIVPLEKNKDLKITEKELTDLSLIKLNLPVNLMTYVIKSIFLKKKILIISDDSFLNDKILEFFVYITQNSFNYNISFISAEDYKNKHKEFKDYMVFENNKIVNNVKKSINPKKLKMEKYIVHKFLSEIDFNSSLIMLKNELQKIYTLSNSIVNLIQNKKENEKINILKISKKLAEIYKIKIKNEYLEFLTEIVKNYFEIKIPSLSQSFHDLL